MKKFLKTALAILPIAVMASCSDDVPGPGNNGLAEKSETRYLRVVIADAKGAPGSRAETADLGADMAYQGGTPEENKIRSLDFYFYDRFKNFHSRYTLSIDASGDDLNKDGALDPDLTSPEDNVYGVYHCNVPIELVQGETLPNYVLCIVNAVEPAQYETMTLDEAQKQVLTTIYGADHGTDTANPKNYFGMSNSVYYGEDKITGEKNALIMATPFDTNKLKTKDELDDLMKVLKTGTEEQKKAIEEELKDFTINVYVERYAVKVNLDITNTSIPAYEAVGYAASEKAAAPAINLTFEPKKWGVNAVEKQFFFLKAYRTLGGTDTKGYGNEFETYDTMNGLLFKGWNNEAAHRSFWARTPGYYKNSYPLVSDEITVTEEDPYGQYDVAYYSYSQLDAIGENEKYLTKYTMETTLMKNRLTGELMGSQYMPLSSIPSVLLAGQYKINGAAVDFYVYGKDAATNKNRIFAGETTPIEGTVKILDKMIDDQSVLMYLDATDNHYKAVNSTYVAENGLRDLFEVVHPSEAVRNVQTSPISGEANGVDGLRVASDIVVLQLKGATDKLVFYNTAKTPSASETGYEPITTGASGNINIVNRLLLQNLGGAHYYKEGMAFFSAPIQHWGWYRTDNENTKPKQDGSEKTINDWDWTKMKTGDFGLVRNHIYSMEIGLIAGLGTAIKDENEPIVPPGDKVPYAVHFHVNIQKWSVLPVQSWNF